MRHGLQALWLVASILLSAVAQSAPSEGKGRPVLDQFNVGTVDSYINGGSIDYAWQQEVTVGISGQLTRIDIFVENDPTNDFTNSTELSVSLGGPWQTSAPVWSITAVLVPGWNTFDLSKKRILLKAGDEFVIGIHGQNVNNLFDPGIAISYGDQYPGGDLYMNGSLNSEVNDILFRTYVKQSAGKGN